MATLTMGFDILKQLFFVESDERNPVHEQAPTASETNTNSLAMETNDVKLEEYIHKEDVDEDEEDEEEDSDEEEEDDDDDSDDEEDSVRKQRIAHFQAISDEHFILLAENHMQRNREHDDSKFQIKRRTHGAYNYVVILNSDKEKVVVKMPITGIKGHWKPEHGNILRSEAHTLMYIKHKLPKFPVAKVFGYDEAFDNVVGAPYILQSCLPGEQAVGSWIDMENIVLDQGYFNNHPTQEFEEKRVKILKSLARHMADLRQLEFDSIGMLYLEDDDPEKPFIGDHWDFIEDLGYRHYIKNPVFKSSADMYLRRHKAISGPEPGLDFMRETIITSEPFASSKKFPEDQKETFTLGHDDIDLQNILVNEEGEVTGILDWDQVTTVPRCIGFASVPVFLRVDFFSIYQFPDTRTHRFPPILFPWNLEKYRKIYADAIKDACGEDAEAAKYCEKSALYKAVHYMMFGNYNTWKTNQENLIKYMMCVIPQLRRADYDAFHNAVCDEDNFGGDWKEGKAIWQDGVPRILDHRNI